MKTSILFIMLALCCNAQSTNATVKAKEKQIEHKENKIVVKSREKGSGKPFKVEKEFTLMFKNNRKGRKQK